MSSVKLFAFIFDITSETEWKYLVGHLGGEDGDSVRACVCVSVRACVWGWGDGRDYSMFGFRQRHWLWTSRERAVTLCVCGWGRRTWLLYVVFQTETLTVDIPREDGDSVRVWVRATDVTTLCLVSERDIDCGHPERGRWLGACVRAGDGRGGQHEDRLCVGARRLVSSCHPGLLTVSTRPHPTRRTPLEGSLRSQVSSQPFDIITTKHKATNLECAILFIVVIIDLYHNRLSNLWWFILLLLRFEFESYDYHSGLKEIHWRLHDSVDPDVKHGQGHVAVRRHKVRWRTSMFMLIQKQVLI